MTLIGGTATIVQAAAGSHVFGPYALPDDEHRLTIVLANWGDPAITVGRAVDISFDGGATWETLAVGGQHPGGGKGRDGSPNPPIGMAISPVPLICQCGHHYLPGDARYERALSHSTVELVDGVTLAQIRRRMAAPDLTLDEMRTRILVDARDRDIDEQNVVRTFHTPTLAAGTPQRQVRLTLNVEGGDVSTVATIETS